MVFPGLSAVRAGSPSVQLYYDRFARNLHYVCIRPRVVPARSCRPIIVLHILFRAEHGFYMRAQATARHYLPALMGYQSCFAWKSRLQIWMC
jgi:hypothetical protein